MNERLVLLSLLAMLVSPGAVGAASHYSPVAHDGFSYDETISLGNGMGNYSGYTESTSVNGSITVNSVLANGTDLSSYYNDNHYENDQGQQESWTSSGQFGFSPTSFLYTDGTDNQTGYVNPSVWFFIDNSVSAGASITLLNSPLLVVSPSVNYFLGTPAGTYVKAIFAEGNGSYERDDDYGVFAASYNWKAYFDPTTGFIISYLYTEQDTDSSGVDGFTVTDSLSVTSTAGYSLTPGSQGSSTTSGGTASSIDWPLIVAGVVVAVVVIVIIVVVAVALSRRRHRLPRHSATGQVSYTPPPMGPAPPPLHLTPSGQPAVQQIIIKETVKVNCRYCGGLIDSTAEKCPFCGAART